MEQLQEEIRPRAEQRLVQHLVLREYARSNEVQITDQELQQGVWNVAMSYGERAKEVLDQFQESRNLLPLYDDLITQKGLRHLVARLTGRPWEEDANEAGGELEADNEVDEQAAVAQMDEGSSEPEDETEA